MLIDEVMAVGDARFQQKCFRRLHELRARGTTILLVTHIVQGLTSICDRVLVLDHGRLVFDGDPGSGIDRYYQLFFTAPEKAAPQTASFATASAARRSRTSPRMAMMARRPLRSTPATRRASCSTSNSRATSRRRNSASPARRKKARAST